MKKTFGTLSLFVAFFATLVVAEPSHAVSLGERLGGATTEFSGFYSFAKMLLAFIGFCMFGFSIFKLSTMKAGGHESKGLYIGMLFGGAAMCVAGAILLMAQESVTGSDTDVFHPDEFNNAQSSFFNALDKKNSLIYHKNSVYFLS